MKTANPRYKLSYAHLQEVLQKVSREDLEAAYYSMNVNEAAEILGIKLSELYGLLYEWNMDLKYPTMSLPHTIASRKSRTEKPRNFHQAQAQQVNVNVASAIDYNRLAREIVHEIGRLLLQGYLHEDV